MIIEIGPNKTPVTVFKPGNLYKLKDQSVSAIYIGVATQHGAFLVSLRDGHAWSSNTTFGNAGYGAFVDVTHEFKVTNIK